MPLGEVMTWNEENTYCSEPVFIQTPGKPDNSYSSKQVFLKTPGKPDNSYSSKQVFFKKLLVNQRILLLKYQFSYKPENTGR